jgi:small nuclear ribonucleoprotein (snRNP)-like protein
MNKILIIIILNLIVLQNEVFATIQKVSEKAVLLQKTKPHLSFKQKVFTYLIQRKMRHLNAKKSPIFAPKGNHLQECVTITLKNGRTILGTIISMDDKNIAYKLCDQSNTAEGTVRIEQVAYVTDAQNRMIFNNQPKSQKTGEITKGDKNATISISALAIALGSVILAFFSALSSFGNSGGDETLVSGLLIVFIIGIVVSLITGIMSLSQMAKTPPQRESSKFLAILSTIIAGLFVVLMLLNLSSGF